MRVSSAWRCKKAKWHRKHGENGVAAKTSKRREEAAGIINVKK